MPDFEICVTRHFTIHEFAYINIADADTLEEAEEWALEQAKDNPHLFEIEGDPEDIDIEYIIERDED